MQLDEMLDKQGTKIDRVLNFENDDSILEERITGQWIHPASGRSYLSKFAPPKVPGSRESKECKLVLTKAFKAVGVLSSYRRTVISLEGMKSS